MDNTPDHEKIFSDRNSVSQPAIPQAAIPRPDAIREQLSRILASRTFRAAHSQIRFLRYVVEETLAGRGGFIKEFMIGMEALGRGDTFDPRLDPIVRTQARKLRARLSKYYETEGSADAVLIEFRKGSYSPAFRWTASEAEASQTAVSAEAADALEMHAADGRLATQPHSTQPGSTHPHAPEAHHRSGPRETDRRPPRAADQAHVWSAIPQKSWMQWAGVLLFLCALAGASYMLGTGWRPGRVSADAASVAVLPFTNLTDNNADEFLSDGLSDELIDSLKQVPGLQVVARTSAFRFKGKTSDIREVSRQLHVRTVLVGTVRKSGERLRVTAQLDSAPAGYHLWTGTFDSDANDAREIPWEIARAVANVLGPSSLRDSEKELAKAFPSRSTPSPGAYQSYLKGLYYWNKLSAEDLDKAIVFFQQAIAEDPSFARAYAALAHCYVMAPQVATSTPTPEFLSMIRSTASRALDLDSTLGDAHFDLAVAAEYEYNWSEAEKEFRRGLQLSPGNAVGHLWYAKFLAITGRKDEVLVQRKIAADLDPVSPYAVQSVAGYLSVVGRYDEAVAQFKSALALDPNFGLAHQGLGVAYLLEGKHDEAIQELQLANKWMVGPRRMALLGYAYGKCGRTAEARKILDEFLREERRGTFPAVAIALVYLGLDDKDHAFEWLDKAIDQRDLDVTLQWDSPFQPLRSDPRFAALLHRMKLA